MKRKILNILVALVMVVGFSLIPAIATGTVEEGSTYIGYKLVESGDGTAAWSTTSELLGDYSVRLVGGAAQDGDDYAAVVLTLDGTMLLSDVTQFIYNYTFTTGPGDGYGPHICFYTRDPANDETAEISLYSGHTSPVGNDIHDTAFGGTPGATGLNTVTVTPETTGFGWFGTEGTSTITQGFGGTGVNRPRTLGDFQDDPDFADHVIDRIQVEYGWWGAGDASAPAYIDDLTLNTTNYDLEPLVLDAGFYKSVGTVTVTVFNGNANADPVRIDQIDIDATSTSDVVGITATLDEDGVNSGVFTGSFVTTGTTPPPADRLLVDEGDTITVKCATADTDWGAGAQAGVSVTATVDDTDPVFTSVVPDNTFYKNEDTITLTVTLDAAGYTVTADFSEIDSEYTAGDEAVSDDTGGVYTVTYDISEDNTIPDEEYTITVTAEDGAGNTVEDDSCAVSLDNTEPAVTDEASDPAVVQPDTATDVIFTANVTDEGSDVAAVTIDLDSIGGSATQAMSDDGATGGDETAADCIYTYTFDDLDIADADDYDLTITATDVVGNVNDTAVITLRVVEDVTDPVIESTEVEYPLGFESARVGDEVIITAVVTDDLAGVDTVTVNATDLALGAAVPLILGEDDTYSVTLVVGAVDADTYTLTITATDAAANTDTADVDVVVVAELTAFNIDLVEGWNLISSPLIPDDSDIDVVLADISDNVSSVWYYDASIADPEDRWLSYAPDAPGDLTDIVDGQGYWIEMTADATLTISGVELPAPPSAPPTYDVYAGWNLIGFKSVDTKTATVYLAGDAFDAFVRMYGFDAAGAIYTTVLIDGNLQPGQGYWLAVSADGTIYP